METPTMTPVQRTNTQGRTSSEWKTFETLEASDIRSILTAHGWENVGNVEKKNFSVTSSEPTAFYTYLKYENEAGQICYTSFNNIISVSPHRYNKK